MNHADLLAIRAQHRAQHRLHQRWIGRRTSVGIVYPGDDKLPAATPERRVEHRRCRGTGWIDDFRHGDNRPQQCSCDRGWISVVDSTLTHKENK